MYISLAYAHTHCRDIILKIAPLRRNRVLSHEGAYVGKSHSVIRFYETCGHNKLTSVRYKVYADTAVKRAGIITGNNAHPRIMSQ